MSQRTFVDSAGTEWRVWEVHPEVRERRQGGDRRGAPPPDPIVERRARPDRRVRARPRALLRPEFAGGWLCFDAASGRRRLAPIPPDWASCTDEELEGHCRRAARAAAPRVV